MADSLETVAASLETLAASLDTVAASSESVVGSPRRKKGKEVKLSRPSFAAEDRHHFAGYIARIGV